MKFNFKRYSEYILDIQVFLMTMLLTLGFNLIRDEPPITIDDVNRYLLSLFLGHIVGSFILYKIEQ